jgi:hypothetical protein
MAKRLIKKLELISLCEGQILTLSEAILLIETTNYLVKKGYDYKGNAQLNIDLVISKLLGYI